MPVETIVYASSEAVPERRFVAHFVRRGLSFWFPGPSVEDARKKAEEFFAFETTRPLGKSVRKHRQGMGILEG
mgnify:CR=1 FL=1